MVLDGARGARSSVLLADSAAYFVEYRLAELQEGVCTVLWAGCDLRRAGRDKNRGNGQRSKKSGTQVKEDCGRERGRI